MLVDLQGNKLYPRVKKIFFVEEDKSILRKQKIAISAPISGSERIFFPLGRLAAGNP